MHFGMKRRWSFYNIGRGGSATEFASRLSLSHIFRSMGFGRMGVGRKRRQPYCNLDRGDSMTEIMDRLSLSNIFKLVGCFNRKIW